MGWQPFWLVSVWFNMADALAISISQKEAKELANRCADLLRDQFGAERVVLIGSVVGDAPWHGRSDLDIAVEGLRSEEFWQALNACYELLPPGLKLDLIPIESAWPELRARIEGELQMPEDPVAALRIEIESELSSLARMIDELSDFLQTAPSEPSKIWVQGCAKNLHDFYNGVERIFERIAVRIDGDLPEGSSWHTLLLQRMGQPFGRQRPAVINPYLEQELSEYLRFRHLFRHTYGYDLQWPRIRELSETLPALMQQLRAQLAAFLSTLDEAEADGSGGL